MIPKNTIAVEVSGGLVTAVTAINFPNYKDINIVVLDYDNINAGDECQYPEVKNALDLSIDYESDDAIYSIY